MAALAVAAAGLGGCSWLPDSANPVEWYRDLTGVSKNDDAGKSLRNAQNLQAGADEPYPNLGTVPPPPERAMSTVDLEKLRKGLAADRANAHYSDEELRQGHSVPPLPGEAPPASAVVAQDGGAAPDQTGAPAPTPATGHGPPAKGPASAPQESPLTTPDVRSLPQGQMPVAAPAPPGAAKPQQQQQAALPPPAAAPAPPPKAAVPAEPTTQPSVMRAPGGRRPSVTLQAAEISFAADGKTLSATDNQQLAEVAKLQKQGGGSVRVIGYGRGAYGADAARQELDSFGDALDRANTVAQALARLGVPSQRITVQAAPEPLGGGPGAGQADVLLDY